MASAVAAAAAAAATTTTATTRRHSSSQEYNSRTSNNIRHLRYLFDSFAWFTRISTRCFVDSSNSSGSLVARLRLPHPTLCQKSNSLVVCSLLLVTNNSNSSTTRGIQSLPTRNQSLLCLVKTGRATVALILRRFSSSRPT